LGVRKHICVLALLVVGCGPAESASQSARVEATGKLDAATQAMLAASDKGRIQGDTTAAIWVVEVSDFQCPYCKMWHDSTYPAIQREFIKTGIVRMAYVNYPLSMHPNAKPAAEAAMCASAQAKFWPMHDRIFHTQAKWAALENPSAVFDSLAGASGVNMSEYRGCLASGAIRLLLATDQQYGLKAGIRSTPTFYIGSEAIAGAAPIAAFREAIGRARTKAAAPPARP
jgi:protein-disulfide isomerase